MGCFTLETRLLCTAVIWLGPTDYSSSVVVSGRFEFSRTPEVVKEKQLFTDLVWQSGHRIPNHSRDSTAYSLSGLFAPRVVLYHTLQSSWI